jgi:site-specific recombinase XerD
MWHLRVWISAREVVDRPALGFHDLRRFYASQLVEPGIDVKVSQELMGHEDIRLTRGLYAQAGDESKQRANDAVAAQLIGTRAKRAMEVDRGTSG